MPVSTDLPRITRAAHSPSRSVRRPHGPSTAARPADRPPHDPRAYDRRRDLPALLTLWPDEIAAASAAEHARLLLRLRSALRRERQRGRSGHWTYDLARHALLRAALREEEALHRARFGPLPAGA